MVDIFSEVDEALKRERVEKLWAEYGQTIIVAAAVLVISTAAGVAWRTWDQNKDAAETARVVQAIDSNNAISELSTIIGDSRSGPEIVALLTAAGLHQEKGGKEKAAALYRQAAEDRSVPKALRDLSRVLYVRTAEGHPADEKLAVLMPVLENENSPYLWQAKVEAALIYADENKYDAALSTLSGVDETDTNSVPTSLKERVRALQAVYQVEAGQQPTTEALTEPASE